jgi:hypothetical protein
MKPHIIRSQGLWWASSPDEQAVYSGKTPSEAYAAWFKQRPKDQQTAIRIKDALSFDLMRG